MCPLCQFWGHFGGGQFWAKQFKDKDKDKDISITIITFQINL